MRPRSAGLLYRDKALHAILGALRAHYADALLTAARHSALRPPRPARLPRAWALKGRGLFCNVDAAHACPPVACRLPLAQAACLALAPIVKHDPVPRPPPEPLLPPRRAENSGRALTHRVMVMNSSRVHMRKSPGVCIP